MDASSSLDAESTDLAVVVPHLFAHHTSRQPARVTYCISTDYCATWCLFTNVCLQRNTFKALPMSTFFPPRQVSSLVTFPANRTQIADKGGFEPLVMLLGHASVDIVKEASGVRSG